MKNTYRIRKANRSTREGCSWVVVGAGPSSIWRTEVWTWSRESAEAIKAALVEGREFGGELYF